MNDSEQGHIRETATVNCSYNVLNRENFKTYTKALLPSLFRCHRMFVKSHYLTANLGNTL